QVAIGLPDPPHVGGGAEGVDADPDGDTSHAGFAGRPISDALAAAKTALRQKVMQFGGARPDQMCKDFSLLPARQVGARARRSQIELVGVGYDLRHRSSLTHGHHTTLRGTARQDRKIGLPPSSPIEKEAYSERTATVPRMRSCSSCFRSVKSATSRTSGVRI